MSTEEQRQRHREYMARTSDANQSRLKKQVREPKRGGLRTQNEKEPTPQTQIEGLGNTQLKRPSTLPTQVSCFYKGYEKEA